MKRGGQRRLDLMGQGLGVALDLLPALEGVAHFLEGPAQLRNLAGPRLRWRSRATE